MVGLFPVSLLLQPVYGISQIAVFKSKTNGKGAVVRGTGSAYVNVKMMMSDAYEDVVRRAVNTLKLSK